MSSSPKYYLGLTFTPDMSDGLHCTHCYFGTLNTADLLAVQEIVSLYFNVHGPVAMRRVAFTVPALFGPEKNIRVLLTPDANAFEPLRLIRQHFQNAGLIGQGSYPFRPHVTCNLHSINKPFTHYVLARDGEIIQSWPIYEAEESDMRASQR